MRVLMQNRVDAFKNMGGDTIQMLKTKEELEKLGVKVDISLELEPDLTEYDLVHLFNITRIHETWLQFKNAKNQNKLIVLSTIHHKKSEIDEYEKKALIGTAKIIKKIFSNESSIQLVKALLYTIQSRSSFKPFWYMVKNGFENEQKEVLEGVDLLLPNSIMEIESIKEDFNLEISNHKYNVIPNGVEFENIESGNDEKRFFEKIGESEFVFCPGRIEPRKNQINIIKALKNSKVKVVFAGAINKKHKKYYKKFLNGIEENDNLYYIGTLDRSDMFNAYKAAKVSILASWFETTGLVGLEAIANDCNIVITEKGYTKEYYGGYAKYCNPENVESIRSSVLEAYYSEFNKDFKKLVFNKYTWKNAAMLTKIAYEGVINESNKSY